MDTEQFKKFIINAHLIDIIKMVKNLSKEQVNIYQKEPIIAHLIKNRKSYLSDVLREIVRLFDVNRRDSNYISPMEYAIKFRLYRCIGILLQSKDIEHLYVNNNDENYFQVVLGTKDTAMIDLFCKNIDEVYIVDVFETAISKNKLGDIEKFWPYPKVGLQKLILQHELYLYNSDSKREQKALSALINYLKITSDNYLKFLQDFVEILRKSKNLNIALLFSRVLFHRYDYTGNYILFNIMHIQLNSDNRHMFKEIVLNVSDQELEVHTKNLQKPGVQTAVGKKQYIKNIPNTTILNIIKNHIKEIYI